jgi:hypothetical protein
MGMRELDIVYFDCTDNHVPKPKPNWLLCLVCGTLRKVLPKHVRARTAWLCRSYTEYQASQRYERMREELSAWACEQKELMLKNRLEDL